MRWNYKLCEQKMYQKGTVILFSKKYILYWLSMLIMSSFYLVLIKLDPILLILINPTSASREYLSFTPTHHVLEFNNECKAGYFVEGYESLDFI